jgi:hypothetical protein
VEFLTNNLKHKLHMLKKELPEDVQRLRRNTLEHPVTNKSVVLQVGVNFTYVICLTGKCTTFNFFATTLAVLVPNKNDNVLNTPCYSITFFF